MGSTLCRNVQTVEVQNGPTTLSPSSNLSLQHNTAQLMWCQIAWKFRSTVTLANMVAVDDFTAKSQVCRPTLRNSVRFYYFSTNLKRFYHNKPLDSPGGDLMFMDNTEECGTVLLGNVQKLHQRLQISDCVRAESSAESSVDCDDMSTLHSSEMSSNMYRDTPYSELDSDYDQSMDEGSSIGSNDG